MRTAKLFNGKDIRLCLDQYGQHESAKTASELRRKCGGGRLSKCYVDKTDGSISHVGYIIGRRWFYVFGRLEVPS